MRPIILKSIVISILTGLALVACLPATPVTPTQTGPDEFATVVAQTVVAELTRVAGAFTPTAVPSETVAPTETLFPTDIPSPTETPAPTNTPLPTETPLPTNTLAPTFTPSPTPIPCDWAEFVTDVTVKDNTAYAPGAVFEKTWRLKNIGTCTWNRDYAVIFDSGDRMDSPAAVNLKDNVRPGEQVDLTVRLTAPASKGTYQGFWKLRSASGVLFGVGPSAAGSFWAKIRVEVPPEPPKMVYDFTAKYCDAAWRNANASLACPGAPSDVAGYAIRIESARLENGNTQNGPVLLTHPQWEGDPSIDNPYPYVINGRFPEFDVRAGDRFQAVIGCLYDALDCEVDFLLRYRIGGGNVITLASWREKRDGKLTTVDVDLSSLAGKSVQFILRVEANQPHYDDQAVWIQPRIMR